MKTKISIPISAIFIALCVQVAFAQAQNLKRTVLFTLGAVTSLIATILGRCALTDLLKYKIILGITLNNNFNFMYQDFSKTAASANSSNAMEREPISKNRVSPKNDKSRGNSVPDAQRSPKGMGEVR